MTKYLVLGLGMMGEAICYDLLTHDLNAEVNALEIDSERIIAVKQKFKTYQNRFTTHQFSITEREQLVGLMKTVDVAFGAIDYKFNVYLTNICIETRTHYLDLGGNPEVVKEQYELTEAAKSAGVTIIPDCGLAPGMVNIITAHLIESMDNPSEAHIRVGGLPRVPTGLLKYQQVFSIRGLTNEYLEDAIVIRDGHIQLVPSMTELETLYFPQPFGTLEAFQTAGGTSSLPRLYEGKLDELTYKTIRYPSHMQYFRFLIDLGLLADEMIPETSQTVRELTEKKLVEYLPRDEPDVVLIRLSVFGRQDESDVQLTWQCIDYEDPESEISAMGRTTSYPISIIGQMIAKQQITDRGVVPGEKVVPAKSFLTELEARDIIFEELD